MGLAIQRLSSRSLFKERYNIIIIGLNCVGKTTIIYKLANGQQVTESPTMQSYVMFEGSDYIINELDPVVYSRFKLFWEHFYNQAEGVIYVVDSANQDDMQEAKNIWDYLLQHEDLQRKSFLIYANKQDLPTAINTAEISTFLPLSSLKDRS